MAIPQIEAVITADTKQAEAGFDRVEQGLRDVGAAADKAGTRTRALDANLGRASRASGAFGRGLQNASYQVGDFAVQVGAGTSASIALGQQLPQLLSGFGILGAAMGAVVAISVPLTRAFGGLTNDTQVWTQVLGTLAPMLSVVKDGLRELGQFAVQAAELLVNNIDRILIIAGTAAAFFAGRWVASFVAARIATFSLSAALAGLRAALIRTGIGALIVGAGELVYQFSRLAKAAGGIGEALGLLADLGKEVFSRLGALVLVGVLRMVSAFYNFRDDVELAFYEVKQSAADAANGLISKMAGAAAAVGAAFKSIPNAIGAAVVGAVNYVISKVSDLIQKAVDGVNVLISGLNAIPGVVLPPITFGGLDGIPLGDAGKAGESIADAFARGAAGAYQIPDLTAPVSDGAAAELSSMADILATAASAPLESIQKMRDLLASIKDDRITLPDLLGVGGGEEGEGGSGKGGGALKKLDEQLTAQEQRIKAHFDRIKALTMGGLSDKLGAWGSYFSNLASLTQSNNAKLLAIAKAAQAAQALMDAWSAYTATLRDPAFVGRPLARVAAAGQVLAAGFGAVNAIKGISASGGGSSGGGGGGASAVATAGRADTLDATIRIESAGGLSSEATQEIASIVVEQFRDRGLTSAQVFG